MDYKYFSKNGVELYRFKKGEITFIKLLPHGVEFGSQWTLANDMFEYDNAVMTSEKATWDAAVGRVKLCADSLA